MSTVGHHIPDLSRKGLRSFGITTGAIVAALFGLFFPLLLDRSLPVWPWVACGVLVSWGLLAPESLRPVYRLWMLFGLMMSRITTPVILSLVFFAIVTPISLLRRCLRKDSMARRLDVEKTSYRVQTRRASKKSLERPF